MTEQYLRVYRDRSEYVHEDGSYETFTEGAQSQAAALRAAQITNQFSKGYLENLINGIMDGSVPFDINAVPEELQVNIRMLVDSVTSEVGRALIGLTFLQLTIKTLSPEQSIRLHKGGRMGSGFSWAEGISMRTIDKNYITPILRKYNLLSLNADGIMMTRSLAENYPYSFLYKADLRGAKEQWLTIVEFLEGNSFKTEEALKFLIKLLLDRASAFECSANETIGLYNQKCHKISSRNDVMALFMQHRDASDYAARLLEICMHSLCQAAVEQGAITLELKPLSQMRSANKKHGNVGDIEFLDGNVIVEAWDAKFGKAYLREELEELHEKLTLHPDICQAGFVTSDEPMLNKEISNRIDEIEELHSVKVYIVRLNEWVDNFFTRCVQTGFVTESELARKWLEAYTLSIAQRKREIAPIDEPCMTWLLLLKKILECF
jgi:hypothetical protein